MKSSAFIRKYNLVQLIVIVFLFVNSAQAEKRKIFIHNVKIGAGIQTLEKDLLVRIQEELPLDVLEKRSYIYEDISAYEEFKQWNPGDMFLSRKDRQIARLLYEKKMKGLLSFSLSYAPHGTSDGLMILSGRLYDLDRMTCLVAGPTGTERSPSVEVLDDRPCKDDVNTSQAVTDASVILHGFDDFSSGLRRLFAKLFRIPEIVMNDHEKTMSIIPGEEVKAFFEIVTNNNMKGTSFWDSNSNSSGGAFNFDTRLHLLEERDVNILCTHPEKYAERETSLPAGLNEQFGEAGSNRTILGHLQLAANRLPVDAVKHYIMIATGLGVNQGSGFVRFLTNRPTNMMPTTC